MRYIKRPSQLFFSFYVTSRCCELKNLLAPCKRALGLFSRRAILGRSNKSTVVLEKIAKENSLNRIGAVNFNKYGKQDGIGFLPCSDKFVDSFLLYVSLRPRLLRDGKEDLHGSWRGQYAHSSIA